MNDTSETWVVKLHDGVYLAPWKGDPGRTLRKESAKEFDSSCTATMALAQARKYRPFEAAKVLRRN